MLALYFEYIRYIFGLIWYIDWKMDATMISVMHCIIFNDYIKCFGGQEQNVLGLLQNCCATVGQILVFDEYDFM